jgi:hypothetical protein
LREEIQESGYEKRWYEVKNQNEISVRQMASVIVANDRVNRSTERRSSGRRWTGNTTIATHSKGLMNVRKVKGMYQLILKLEAFKKARFEFRMIDQIQSKIEELPEPSSNAALVLSSRLPLNVRQS